MTGHTLEIQLTWWWVLQKLGWKCSKELEKGNWNWMLQIKE
jgi:hypothetical protein